LLITSDQHRASALGCAGDPCIRTPHLDLLTHEGVRATAAYSDCPVCIPARTTMNSGLQSHHYGMPSYVPQ
jgi:choline-sulfatase